MARQAAAVDERWPIFFVARALRTARTRLEKGQQWPRQSRQEIRAWASAFALDESAPWDELSHVVTLLADAGDAQYIIEKGLDLDAARAFLKDREKKA
jgi:hypothetical protein